METSASFEARSAPLPHSTMRVCSERAQKAEITGTRRAESPRRSRCTTDAKRAGENAQERKASWASLRGFAGREATDEHRVEALGSGDAVRPEDRPSDRPYPRAQ